MERFDLHMHTTSSPDGNNTPYEMAVAAKDLGVNIISITEHYDAMETYPPGTFFEQEGRLFTIDEKKLDRDFNYARENCPKGIILINGIELGQIQFQKQASFDFCERHNFDYIIGSMHNLRDDIDIGALDFNIEKPKRILKNYLDDMLELCACGGFDGLGHIDFPFRYIPPNLVEYTYKGFEPEIDLILRSIISQNILIEINGAGLRKFPKQIGPEKWVLKRFIELGLEAITFGSDAHSASQLMLGFNESIELARSAGIKYAAYFIERKPVYIKL